MAKSTYAEARDYITMTAEKPNETRREGECFRRLFAPMAGRETYDVLELFAGIGLFASLLDELQMIHSHEAWDYSEACIERLKGLRPHSKLHVADSFERAIGYGAYNLISADFNSWTLRKFVEDKRYRAVTDRIFKAGSQYVQLTDAAVGWVHLNAPTYRRCFDRVGFEPVNWTETPSAYLREVAAMLAQHYGYGIVRIAWHSRAGYMLFRKGPFTSAFEIVKVE